MPRSSPQPAARSQGMNKPNAAGMRHQHIARNRSIAAIAACLLVLSGSTAFLVWYIDRTAVDVVYADTWAYLPMVGRALSGGFSATDLFAAHNENRTLLLNAVLLASAKFDAFNLVHADDIGVLFIAATGLVLLSSCINLFRGRDMAMAAAFICSALLVSALEQWEDLLLPINFVFFATITFGVAAIVLMHRYVVAPRPRLLSAAFLGSIAVSELALFSMGGGVVVWGINALQITLSYLLHKTRTGSGLIVYVAVGGVSIAGYLHGLGHQIGVGFSASHPWAFVQFFLIGLGNSLVGFFHNEPYLPLDMTAGTLLFACYCGVTAIWLRLAKADQAVALGLLCLVLLGVGEEALIALGRLPYGVSYAAASRYSALTLISVAASLVFFAWHAPRSRSSAVIAVLLGLAVVTFSMIDDRNELGMADARRQYGEHLQSILRSGQIEEAEAESLEWGQVQGGSAQDIVDGNAILRDYRLSFYHNEPSATLPRRDQTLRFQNR